MRLRIHSYKSGKIQNEIISIIKSEIVHDIVEKLNHCSTFSIICDETTYSATKEQVSACVRLPYKTQEGVTIRERFLGFVNVAKTTGENLHYVIKGFLEEIGVNVSRMRGQAYDGASNISGLFNVEDESRASYSHCHAPHLLDLAVMRFCEEVKPLRYAQLNFTNPCFTLVEFAYLFLQLRLATNAPDGSQLFEIALSWPIITKSAGRFFSTLWRLKTHLRCTMGENRLSGLALMAIDQEASSKLMQTEGLDRLVEKFSASAWRRMIFIKMMLPLSLMICYPMCKQDSSINLK
ncbi:hypothetical protein PR048_021481 [Dryococelus australis]|uniref:DUF4371 domain-containing protein n=1 Tax=Dryococelus australis TaxID=614101 RepID=A0ABQ9GYB4_9NEOP|nr:hypothetical protein PR048_021481 [Dryococelus australis]